MHTNKLSAQRTCLRFADESLPSLAVYPPNKFANKSKSSEDKQY